MVEKSEDTISCETFRVNARHINLYQAIFESYEGLGLVRTVDPSEGIIEIMYSSSQRETVLEVIKNVTSDLY